ncbi:restriction endonuclease subunit S [Antrihabitans spumae]
MRSSAVPEGWTLRPLLELVSIRSGQVNPTRNPFNTMLMVAPDHIQAGTGRLLARKTAEEQGAISGKYLVEPGDVVYSKIRPYLRKAIISDFHGLCSADMYPFTPRNSTDSRFILGIILSNRFSEFAISVSARSGIPKINREELAEYSLPAPRGDEQRAIGNALSDVDALISSLERLIAKKQAVKQGAMQQLLTADIHDDWKLQQLGTLLTGHPSYGINAAASTYSHDEPTYLRITDISDDGRFTPDPKVSVRHPSAKSYFLRDGDLVFARTGASTGKAYRYRPKDGPLVYAGFLIRVTPDPARLDPSYLSYFVQSKSYWDWVAVMSVRSGQPGINGNEYAGLPISFPKIEQQRAISSRLADMDEGIEILATRLAKTRAMKQGMMQELLTGRTRLPTEGAAS